MNSIMDSFPLVVNSLLVWICGSTVVNSLLVLLKEDAISHKRRYCSEQIENLSEDDKVTHNGVWSMEVGAPTLIVVLQWCSGRNPVEERKDCVNVVAFGMGGGACGRA